MRVFVLSCGRSGSMTLARVFGHAENYTAGHESEAGSFYPLAYPDWHVESDNRLSWMLGSLAEKFPEARYIHLIREQEQCARSFEARADYPGASIRGFGAGILGRGEAFQAERYQAALRMWEVVNANIREFLWARPHETALLEDLPERVPALWAFAGAEGALAAAIAEARIHHNAQLSP